MIKLGSHISFKAPNYLIGAVEESLQNGANAMMIYLGPPQMARLADPQNYKLDEYRANYQDKIKPEDIVIHAHYVINPASLEKGEFAKEFLIKTIANMNLIKAKYLVLHPGSSVKYDRQESINYLIKNLIEILDQTKDVEILLETMAGKGNEIGWNFGELNFIIENVNSNRLGVCLDTCHVWESGFDLRNYDNLISELKKYNLLQKIKVTHINDSKNNIGARKDRHQNLNKGFIPFEAIMNIINGPEFKDVIHILETPWVDGKSIYKDEIELIKQNLR